MRDVGLRHDALAARQAALDWLSQRKATGSPLKRALFDALFECQDMTRKRCDRDT
jgi:hypothetical protein